MSTAIGLFVLLFILVNIPAVQEYAKDFIVKELKRKIGTELGIGKLSFTPFNTVELDSVYLYDQSNEKVLIANNISASIDLLALFQKKIVITSAWLSDFEIHLSKDSINAPLNIQYIIEAFKKQDNTPKSQLDIKLSSVNISKGNFYFDIKNIPSIADSNRFDKNHIAISDLEAKVALKSLKPDSLNIQVKKFGLKEKSGLEISNLLCRIVTDDKKISIRGFNLDLPSSKIELDRCEIDVTPTSDTLQALDYATLDCIIGNSQIAPKDISALVPAFRNFEDHITLDGQVNGSIDNLTIADLTILYGEKMHLKANVEIKDIRNPEETYILGGIDELKISSSELEKIINNFSNGKTKLPSQLNQLGTIFFEGDISGYLSQLTAFGSISTDLGILKTDVLFGLKPNIGIDYSLKGKVSTNDFKIGKLLNNKDLNLASFNVSVDLNKPTNSKIKGDADGEIFSVDFKDYTYNDIKLDINYDGLRLDGDLNIDDPNGKLNVSGLFDLSDKEKPELIFRAKAHNIQLSELNIAKNMHHSYLTFNIDANFSGKNIDNAEGYIRIDSIDFIREDMILETNKILIEATVDSIKSKKLKITSSLINGEITGQYAYSSIAKSILSMFQPYLPALITRKETKTENLNNFSFNFTINNTENFSKIFKVPVTVISPSKIIGFYDDSRNKFKVEAFTPVLKAAGMNISSGYILAENNESKINTRIDAQIIGKKATNDVSIQSSVENNSINTNISFSNDGKQMAKGNFSINTLFTKDDKDPLEIDIKLLPSELTLNSLNWNLKESDIHIESGTYEINNFELATDDKKQILGINGKYSPKNPTDVLEAELKDINLEYIFQTLAIDVLKFGGLASGNLYVSTIENKPYANTQLEVTDMSFNGTYLGNLKLFSELDKETNKVILNGLITSRESKITKVDGTIDPIKQGLSIHFDADSLDISFLNTYASAVFQNISGRGTGKVHLFGDFSDVTVEGKAFIQDGNIGIGFLNTNYKFTDTVFMKKDLIYFNNLALIDQYDNRAIANGKVSHDFFRDFNYQVDFTASNFLVYNATKAQNPIFYGTVFGSGKGSVGGDEQAVDINVSMRTEDKTAVRMNFMEEFVNEYSFITYKDKKQHSSDSISSDKQIALSPIKTNSGMEINMDFYIDATPDAVVEILMDPVGGDVIRGSGNGAMQFQWNSKSAPLLFGTYNISRGSYNFTFQRILERRFSIEEGSNVQFRGDPFQATLDVSAVYKVNASLNDLDRELAKKSGQTTIPVNCILNLTGALKHPTVDLDLKFPAADAEIERQVKNLISTEDLINKQVTFLLLLSRFYKPDGNADTQDSSDLAVLASATLSNQLTKIVSSIDDRWELGTNIKWYNYTEDTNMELELLVGSRLLNDRLLINGNFGYRNDININKDAMIADVDIEYLLNNAGTWRIKAYNHYNEKYYYIDRTSYTQGFGIVYKKDFDNIKDLFGTLPLRKRIKKDSVQTVLPDSTKKGSALSNFIKLKKK